MPCCWSKYFARLWCEVALVLLFVLRLSYSNQPPERVERTSSSHVNKSLRPLTIKCVMRRSHAKRVDDDNMHSGNDQTECVTIRLWNNCSEAIQTDHNHLLDKLPPSTTTLLRNVICAMQFTVSLSRIFVFLEWWWFCWNRFAFNRPVCSNRWWMHCVPLPLRTRFRAQFLSASFQCPLSFRTAATHRQRSAMMYYSWKTVLVCRHKIRLSRKLHIILYTIHWS